MIKLDQSIKDLEEDIFKQDTPELRHKLLLLKAEFNDISTNKAAANITRLKQTYYDQGEKAGRLLAWRIKAQQNEGRINKIETIDGQNTTIPTEINNAFRNYYEDLYKSTPPENTHHYKKCMDEIQIQSLSEEDSKILDQPIEIADLKAAINCMNSGKAPGPDGLPIDIYKIFRDKLMTPMMDMINESFNICELPLSLRSALITLIPKPGKDPTKCGSYRPISLLNSDTNNC